MANRQTISIRPTPDGLTMADVYKDNAVTAAAIAKDEAFQKASDKHFRETQPELLPGRHFLWNVMRFHKFGNEKIGQKYDATFKGCIGSDEWMDAKFCPDCGWKKWKCKCKP